MTQNSVLCPGNQPGARFTKIYTNSYLLVILFHHDGCAGIKIHLYHLFCKGICCGEVKKNSYDYKNHCRKLK